MIEDIPADASRQTFMRVAKQMLQDGDLNWGRVTMLFYFSYKMICKVHIFIRLQDEYCSFDMVGNSFHESFWYVSNVNQDILVFLLLFFFFFDAMRC